MKRNIELKARFPDLGRGHLIARSLGAVLDSVERQCDTYFAVHHGRLKLRQRWLTQASEPGEISKLQPAVAQPSQLIWYHRSNEARARPSDYSLLELPDGEATQSMLKGALGVVVQVTKLRTVYLFDHVRIHLDRVSDLGTFLEFEAIVDETCDDAAAEQKICKLRAVFQLPEDKILTQSYADMLMADH